MDLRSLIAKMDAIESKISEAPEVAPAANPYTDPVQAAIYAAMSPADQAWATKGGGRPDLTDKYIAARAPNKFKPVAPQAAAPAPVTPQAANPAPVVAPTDGSTGVNAQGQNVTIQNPDGSTTNPEDGKVTPAQTFPVAEPTATHTANPAAPINRDAMPFGKAFADARAKGEKQFAWKGKKYAVQMAAPKSNQGANPAPAAVKPQIQPSVGMKGIAPSPGGYDQDQANTLNNLAAGGMGAESIERGALAKALIESFGYTK